MTNVNFDALPKVSGGTFKFDTVGKVLQGTLTEKKQKPDQYKPGHEVTIIEVKTPDNKIVTHFCNDDVAREIKEVKVGQYVKIVFTKQLPQRSPTVQGKKIIEVYSDPSLVDTEWLNEQAESDEVQELANQFGGQVVAESSENSLLAGLNETLPPPQETPGQSVESTICNLAKAKIPGTTDANFKEKVMEGLGVAFIPLNYSKILEMLNSI